MNLFGIERYAIGDTLYNWSNKLNLREKPNLNSKIITHILEEEIVIPNQNKYYKNNDISIIENPKKWKKAITGKWLEVNYRDHKGFVFDAYLSKYSKKKIKDQNHYIEKNEIQIPDYEMFTRFLKEESIIHEIGIGSEWGIINYYIPDMSIEEGIYLLKEEHIDNNFGKKNWQLNLIEKEIKMHQSDEIYYEEIRIRKIENMCIITIEYGM